MKTAKPLIAMAAAALVGAPALHAQDAPAVRESTQVLERISVTGGADRIREVAGSAQTLSREDLDRQNHDDPMRVLRQIPGVYVTEEEGHGLFPNISIRGARQERNNRITVMEDGVLIAPAPYSAPAAYYFPSIQRMDQVEVRKGSSSIEYGPYTIGGALNMISTPIPFERRGRVTMQAAERDGRRVHGWFGDSAGTFGYLIEGYTRDTDGFRRLDVPHATGHNMPENRPGYDNQNYVAKFRINSSAEADRYQEVEVKVGQDRKSAQETYVGLTREDFRADPFRRYAGTAADEINTEHEQIQVRHFIEFTPDVDLTTTIYNNDFARNWYKLASVDGTGLTAVLENPDTYTDAISWLRGDPDDPDTLGNVRANNRTYYSRGVESRARWRFSTDRIRHELRAGVRIHKDEEDRLQWDDTYRMEDNSLVLVERGVPGSQTNRITQADAYALFVQNRMDFGRFAITPGLRYENITIKRTDYQRAPTPDRSVVTGTSKGTYSEFVPGIGATLEVNPELQLLAGVYRGFAPTGASDSDAEKATNYEAGLRYRRPHFRSEVIGFFNDYGNLSGVCTASSGGGCEVGDVFSAGKVQVYGLEALAMYDAGRANGLPFGIPLSVAYTYTRGEFRESFDSDFAEWGEVESGDELAYLPEHQLSLGVGLERGRLGLDLRANYVSETRTQAGSGAIPEGERIESRWLMDLGAGYRLNRGVRLFASVENLADKTYIANQKPHGVRVGKPRTVLLGATLDF